MSKDAHAFWELLNKAEDLVRTGKTEERAAPGSVQFREELRRQIASSSAGAAAGGAAARVRPDADASGGSRTGGAPAGTDPVASAGGWGSGVGEEGDPQRQLRERRLAMLEERVHACTRCQLHSGRMNAVPGTGVLDPLVMVVGEGPGAEEDRRGLPFVGRAGQFLDKWLEAIGMSRSTNAYIANIVKCRPPQNRDPHPHESEACLPYLREQVSLIRPHAILTVGRIASGILIGSDAGIGKLRGRTYYYDGTPLVPTYHPSGVLRNPDLKRPVWEDLKRLRALLPEDE